MTIDKSTKIYVAGHCGMVGSALVRRLRQGGDSCYINIISRTHAELDLTNQAAVQAFFEAEKPEYVFLAAAKVGDLHANSTNPADVIYENMQMQNNVIKAAHQFGVKWLCFVASSCIYPRDCPQPIKEEYFLTGPLDPSCEPYAIAKMAGIELCNAYNSEQGTRFVSVVPPTLYSADAQQNPADLQYLGVDDMADACVFLMEHGISGGIYNIADGAPGQLLDASRLSKLGWRAKPAAASHPV
jgi:GDP-L-fucose synthase